MPPSTPKNPTVQIISDFTVDGWEGRDYARAMFDTISTHLLVALAVALTLLACGAFWLLWTGE
jgi:hypothetical protein